MNVRCGGRFPGHPGARAERVRAELGWEPRYDDLRTIVEDVWRWERKLAGK